MNIFDFFSTFYVNDGIQKTNLDSLHFGVIHWIFIFDKSDEIQRM